MQHGSITAGTGHLSSNGRLAACAEDIRERLETALNIVGEIAVPAPALVVANPATQRLVRNILAVRRSRERFFAAELFADPAWDILLELYAAELGQQRVTVSSLCIGAAVPATTALRWINLLEKRGMIVRSPDPFDRRRAFLELSSDALEAMERFFSSIPPEM